MSFEGRIRLACGSFKLPHACFSEKRYLKNLIIKNLLKLKNYIKNNN
jgi:hypothetical protein